MCVSIFIRLQIQASIVLTLGGFSKCVFIYKSPIHSRSHPWRSTSWDQALHIRYGDFISVIWQFGGAWYIHGQTWTKTSGPSQGPSHICGCACFTVRWSCTNIPKQLPAGVFTCAESYLVTQFWYGWDGGRSWGHHGRLLMSSLIPVSRQSPGWYPPLWVHPPEPTWQRETRRNLLLHL